MFKLCVCFHSLTMTPYLSDLAARLSGLHRALIYAQQTPICMYTHRNTHTQTNSYLLAFLIAPVCIQKWKHLAILAITLCDTFKG